MRKRERTNYCYTAIGPNRAKGSRILTCCKVTIYEGIYPGEKWFWFCVSFRFFFFVIRVSWGCCCCTVLLSLYKSLQSERLYIYIYIYSTPFIFGQWEQTKSSTCMCACNIRAYQQMKRVVASLFRNSLRCGLTLQIELN